MNTLITKTPAEVTDKSLPKIDEMAFLVKGLTGIASFVVNAPSQSGYVRIEGSAYFTNPDGTVDYGKVRPYDGSSTQLFRIKGDGTDFYLFYGNKYGLIRFSSVGNDAVSISCKSNTFQECDALKYLGVQNIGFLDGEKLDMSLVRTDHLLTLSASTSVSPKVFKMDLSDLDNIDNMTHILAVFFDSAVTGDLSAFEDNTALIELDLSFNAITGDISSLSKATSMTTLTLTRNPNITGTLESLLDGLYSNGKTSGTLSISVVDTSVTYNGAAVTSAKTATFTSSGWSIA